MSNNDHDLELDTPSEDEYTILESNALDDNDDDDEGNEIDVERNEVENVDESSDSDNQLSEIEGPVLRLLGTGGLGAIIQGLASAANNSNLPSERRVQRLLDVVTRSRSGNESSNNNIIRNKPRSSDSWWKKPHEKPQRRGVELQMGGEFGRVSRRLSGQKNLAKILRDRRMSSRNIPKQDICENLVPNSAGSVVAMYPSTVYCGQFSADSSFYYVCRKDFNLHIYNMISPRKEFGDTPGKIYTEVDSHHQTTMKVHKSIKGIEFGWTITDSHLSPDNERLIYSAMNSTVFMVKTMDYDNVQIPINFADQRPGRGRVFDSWGDDSYCIWSCRFSADGNEIIAGGREKIFVYDLLANRRTVKISAHDDDVNSCCWADSGSNVLISASDDTFIKVWDRRSLGSTAQPSGVLIGHTEGITNVSAKGDGRYIISNGKDQALRLWDLRKMASNLDYEAVKDSHYGLQGFDYRYPDSRRQKIPAHPKDCSIMTYRGHTVMRTLIRCHFSPAETTGSQYIYSGSTDGRIHIWSLDGRVVQVLDRSQTLPMSYDSSSPDVGRRHNRVPGGCVRDVSWHTQEPVLLSAAWARDGTSSVARHEWKGLSKTMKLEDWVIKEEAEASEQTGLRRSRRLARLPPGAYLDAYLNTDEFDDDDSDDYGYY